MRRFSWLQSLQRSWTRASARRTRRAMVQLERLEDRTVPVCIMFAAGELSVMLNTGNTELNVKLSAAGPTNPVVVTVDGFDFVLDGTTYPGTDACSGGITLAVNAQDVTSIVVTGNDNSNSIDLSAVDGAVFTALVNPNATTFPVTINGGAGDDTIIGSTVGAMGDSIDGGPGNDSIDGSRGDDSISGGDGNDTIDGGDGSDMLNGNAGDDSLLGGNDADTLNGGDGNDVEDGKDGDDSVSGGLGNDTLHGGAGNDSVMGDAGNDNATGDDGNDQVRGGSGNDTIDGGVGTDTVFGDDGDDVLVWSTFDATETGDGGSDTSASGGPGDTVSVVNTAGNGAFIVTHPTASTLRITAATGATFTLTSTEHFNLPSGSAAGAPGATFGDIIHALGGAPGATTLADVIHALRSAFGAMFGHG